ncbi:MAG: bifunctional DNA-formamidopyrimidine glycosylase/DNA-(apurinic or apyrimidinic site) lyase [Chloroflexi bacterium]|nr:bifunctional DNA-formamidopyrimidine glycosylase/DNA-(apurinic or apyrimidinic site) lyase [Chloroflexota bacterium]
MPELPEVETTANGLRPWLVGRAIATVENLDWPRILANTTPELLMRFLVSERVASVERRGKFLILTLESGAALAIHRKMSGNIVRYAGPAVAQQHTHLVVRFDDGSELHFVDPRKFGRVYLFETREMLDVFIAERLGPEPLTELTPESLGQLLRSRRRAVKPLLLDQRVVAGLGNLYTDESLWEAGLHPARRSDSLVEAEVTRLHAAIVHVLNGAIQRRGTSFSDYRDADGQPGENQGFLKAYGRAGQTCTRCGGDIRRIVLGQRGTWICETCQPLSP